MLASVSWISQKYNYFNNLIWNGELPQIAFKVNHSTSKWGFATYQFNTWNNTVTPVSITISNQYDSPENIKLGVLIHEMIHIADYTWHPEHFVYNGRKVSKKSYDAHGSVYFLPQMRRINELLKEKGFDIIVSPNVQQSEVDASTLNATAQARVDNRKNQGTSIFVYSLTGENNGKLAISYCQQTMHDRWVNYIKYDDWWSKTREWTDEYLAHSDFYAKQRSLNIGHGRYLMIPLDDFVKKHNLQYIGHLQGKKQKVVQPVPQPTVTPQPQEDRIKVFRFNTVQGNTIEFRDLTKSELKVKLKERFPKWSDESIERVVNNPKYCVNEMKVTEEDIKKMVQESVEQIINQEPTQTPVGMRRSKIKQIDKYTYQQSIE